MKFLLGEKQRMLQMFDDTGRANPVTELSAGPVTVTALKTPARDHYPAVQVGYGQKRGRAKFRYLREHRLPTEAALTEYQVGAKLSAGIFALGEKVMVSCTSKGKGFQGVVKRHGFHGGPRTHGQKHAERKPGSIGGGLRTRVPKGMRMAGRMGGTRVTVRNLVVMGVDQERNLLWVRGAVPGRRGSLVEIYAN